MLYDSYPPGNGPPSDSFPSSAILNDYSDYGFRKTITFLQSPTVGASFLALTLFFMITFTSDALFNSVTLTTLGITITLSVLAFTGVVILLLFLL